MLSQSGNIGMEDWTDFHAQHSPLVWTTVYRILDNHAEALDCCQDLFAELIAQHRSESVRNWPAFLKWLATRRAIDRLRRRRVEGTQFQTDSDICNVSTTAFTPDERAISNELQERIKYELGKLPEQQAEAFWLFSIEQLSYAEIAQQLGSNVNQVGVLVHRARHKLRTYLADLVPATKNAKSAPKLAHDNSDRIDCHGREG
jgi:RNA polymerase sigma-70 factor, ECF subfamily